jgi:cytoskeletal protein CcmA (bactofilin family)
MWNKKTEEETAAPRPVQRPIAAAPMPVRTAPAPPPAPIRAPEEVKRPGRGGSLGSTMTVKGEVYSQEELYVDGEVHGSIELHHRLTVGPNGKIKASVKAKEVVIEGSIQGDVQSAEKIIIREKGSLVGDIKTAGIVIEDGAYFKGSIDIVRPTAAAQKVAVAEPVLVHASEAAS